jgi:hypothetical protein
VNAWTEGFSDVLRRDREQDTEMCVCVISHKCRWVYLECVYIHGVANVYFHRMSIE